MKKLFYVILLIVALISCAKSAKNKIDNSEKPSTHDSVKQKPVKRNTLKKDVLQTDHRGSTSPSFPGGIDALKEYFKKNVPCIDSIYWSNTRYSQLQFEIDVDGKILNMLLFNNTRLAIDNKENEKCWDAIMKMPQWIPGTENYKKVKSHVSIPIKLRDFNN